MKHSILGFLVSYLILGMSPIARSTPILAIDSVFSSQSLGPSMEYLVDHEGLWDLEGLEAKGSNAVWAKQTADVPDLGYVGKNGAVWARLDLKHEGSIPHRLILEASYAPHDHIDVYVITSETTQSFRAGDHTPHSAWPKYTRYPTFPFEIHEDTRILIKVSGSTPMQFPVKLYEAEAYQEMRVTRESIQALYYGAILALIAYNLFVGIGTGIRTYLYYVGFLLSFGYFQLSLSGYLPVLFRTEFPIWLLDYGVFLGVGLTAIFSHLFSAHILGVSYGSRIYQRTCAYFIGATLAIIPVSLIFTYRFMVFYALVILTLPWFASIAYYIRRAFRKNEPVASLFTVAWSVFIMGSLCIPLKSLGLLPVNAVTDNLQQIGSAFEFILLSFALAYRIKTLQGRINFELVEKERARTIFFHNTSHELRTPLNGIIGFLELIYQGSYGVVSNEAKQQIGKALRLAGSLKVQVNTILDLAKSRQGELHLRVQPIELKEMKADADNLAEGLCLKAKGLHYKSNLKALDNTFCGDREKIFTILRNLLGNAFKFKDSMRDNFVELRLTQNEDHILIEVEDTGIGIPESAKERIFEEFAQVQDDARRAYEGTGLGLTMVRDLVRLMQGSIEVSSSEGRGSCFLVRIPKLMPDLVQNLDQKPMDINVKSSGFKAESLRHLSSDTPQPSLQSHVGSGLDILVVDDNEMNCEVISGILQIDGYQVRSAISGKSGIEAMRSQRPHVLLLDMMMPEMSGADVIQIMKKDPILQEIPIILITARASEEDRIEGLRTGADDYLPKPIFAAELRLRVHNMIERHSLLRQAERSAQDDKLIQLGELFADLSHELKNILHAAGSSTHLSQDDALLSTAVLAMEDSERTALARGLIDPSHHPEAFRRMDQLQLDNHDPDYELRRQLRARLSYLNIDFEGVQAIWGNLSQWSGEELTYAASQWKIFIQYNDLLQSSLRSRDVTKSILNYTRDDKSQRTTELLEAWKTAQIIMHAKLKNRPIVWNIHLDPATLALAQSSLIQVLLNLCLNAADAIEKLESSEQWITLATHIENKRLILDISNGGQPIPSEIQSRLFQRGFSTKGEKGNGIGLYVSNRLLSNVGANLTYVADGRSPCFRLSIPLKDEQVMVHVA